MDAETPQRRRDLHHKRGGETVKRESPGYIDPEYAQSGHVTRASDIFSTGIVALELISGAKPFDQTKDPSWILDQFEEALEDETLLKFSTGWPGDAAQQLAGVVKAFINRRGRKRPDASTAAKQVNELCKTRGASPMQLLALEGSGPTCVVCLNNPATHALLPCGHRCVCANDAARITTCPICRVARDSSIHIFDA